MAYITTKHKGTSHNNVKYNLTWWIFKLIITSLTINNPNGNMRMGNRVKRYGKEQVAIILLKTVLLQETSIKLRLSIILMISKVYILSLFL